MSEIVPGPTLPASWQPIDLGPVWDGLETGTIEMPIPTVGRRSDGAGLFYPGRLNGVFGRFGSAKSYVAAVVAVQEISLGGTVVWVDFEDNATGMTQRLIELGADRTDVVDSFRYLNPDEALNPKGRTAFVDWVSASQPTLAVADSVGEWLSLQGANPNADDEVAAFLKAHLAPLTECGAAVVLIDHVPHDTKDPLRAIGSQRKMTAVTGVALHVQMVREMGKDRSGMARLKSAKDRLGTYPRGTVVAELTIDATIMPYGVELAAPAEPSQWKPTVLMERVSTLLASQPDGLSKRAVRERVDGKAGYVDQALEHLIAEGYVSVEPGARGAHIHKLVRAFEEHDSAAEPIDLLQAELGAQEIQALPDPI